MKKNLVLITLLLITTIFAGCTQTKKSTASPSSQNNTAQRAVPTIEPVKTASSAALPTFAPTSDEDIKAIDKSMDQVNFNDYSDKSLDDLK